MIFHQPPRGLAGRTAPAGAIPRGPAIPRTIAGTEDIKREVTPVSEQAKAARGAGVRQKKRAAAGAILLEGQPGGRGINPAATLTPRVLIGA